MSGEMEKNKLGDTDNLVNNNLVSVYHARANTQRGHKRVLTVACSTNLDENDCP